MKMVESHGKRLKGVQSGTMWEYLVGILERKTDRWVLGRGLGVGDWRSQGGVKDVAQVASWSKYKFYFHFNHLR